MPGPRYIADPPEAIRAVELDGLIALFHRPSGTTHILAPPSPQILGALQQGPATAAAILKRISAQFEIEDRRGRMAALAARLDELMAAGLVRRL
jgi:PqqD family protein of HPr-rel-A system